MIDLVSLLNRTDTSVAVVGANDDPSKFGFSVYRDLKRKGFTVYAVNPNRDSVDGDFSYPDVAAIDPEPVIVNFVVPPDITLRVLRQCLEMRLPAFWFQPGSHDARALSFVREHDFSYLADACIMVEARSLLQK